MKLGKPHLQEVCTAGLHRLDAMDPSGIFLPIMLPSTRMRTKCVT
jgi:hypothetical protein